MFRVCMFSARRRGAGAGVESGFGWLRLVIAVLIAGSSASTAAFSQSCPDSGQTVKADSSDYSSGIVCGSPSMPVREDYSFALEDGLSISSDSGKGIHFEGQGDITIATKGPKHDVSVTGGPGHHAVHVQGRGSGTQELRLEVGDVTSTADGIRVTGLTGKVDIKARGSVRASGELNGDSGGAILVRLVDPNPPGGQVTNIEVNEIVSAHTLGNAFLAAGVLVDAPGDINVISEGTISTTGDYVHGVSVLLGTNSGKEPGSVDVSVGSVSTTGKEAHALYVTRYADPAKAKTAALDLTVTGEMKTAGWGAHGIVAEGRNTAVIITLDDGASVAVLKAKDGWESDYAAEPVAKAVYAADLSGGNPISSVIINSRGTMTGEVYAESCAPPLFTNRGILNAGEKIELIVDTDSVCGSGASSSGRLENFGTVAPGGGSNIATAEITGDYTQKATGTLELDVDWSKNSSDLLEVKGKAGLAGSISVSLHSDPADLPLAGTDEAKKNETLVLTASGGILGEGALSLPDTLTRKHALTKDATGKKLYLSSYLDLDPDGTNENQKSVLESLYSSEKSGKNIRSAFRDILNHTEAGDLRFDLDGLGNEIAAATLHTGVSSALRSAREMPSCLPKFGRGRAAGVCVGANGTWFEGSSAANADQLGFGFRGNRITQAAGWVFDDLDGGVGISIGLGYSAVAMGPHAKSAGESFSGGLKWTGLVGPVAYSLAAAAGWASFDVVRTMPQNGTMSSGKLRLHNYSLHGQLGYPLHFNSVQITPSVGLDATLYGSKPYSESGADDLSLHVDAVSGTAVDARLGVTVSGWGTRSRSFALTPVFNLTWMQSSQGEISVDSRFAGSGDAMRSTVKVEKASLRAEIGARFASSSGNLSGKAGLVYSRGVSRKSYRTSAAASVTYLF